ncbi:MAG: Lead, cadmium, zinc and mercury transporting ATPase [Myxococcales bacterium]|nr:Lead, cadmium, zinc and mercury transporting ATPase [Myxococcales bacterium]
MTHAGYLVNGPQPRTGTRSGFCTGIASMSPPEDEPSEVESRRMFDNLRKAIAYWLGGLASQLVVLLVAALAGLPLPLLPVHLLWISVLTNGLPALALVMDPIDDDAMRRPPHRPGEPLLGGREGTSIGLVAVLEAAVTIGVFVWALQDHSLANARDLAFSVLVFAELFRSVAARSTTRVFWQVGPLGNLMLVGVIAGSVLLHLVIHHVPWTKHVLELHAMSSTDWLLVFTVGLMPVTVLELIKLTRALMAIAVRDQTMKRRSSGP